MIQFLTMTVLLAQSQAPQSQSRGDNLAGAAMAVFATKCIQCHGPELPHPKAAFGYITDLRRLVASDKYIVPEQPEKSAIWQEISEDDMPPDGAKAGPLAQAEKDAVLAWIVAGAPLPSNGLPTGPPVDTSGSSLRDVRPDRAVPHAMANRFVQRVMAVIGRAHVIVVHFPVAMLITAALTELWASLRRAQTPLPAVRLCLWVGSASGLAAGSLGWVHALDGFPGPSANPMTIAGLHRWLGTAAAVLAPVVALVAERDARLGKRSPLARGGILALGASVAIAAHFGGLLTHGPGFFDP